MTFHEFANAMAVLEAGVNDSMTASTAEVWFDLLGDLPVESLQAAVKRYLAESEYPGLPPVGKLRRLAADELHGERLTAGESWELACRASRHWSAYSEQRRREAHAMLDPLTARAVRCIGGLHKIGSTEAPEIVAGQYRRIYESLADREQRHGRLPDELRPRIGNGALEAVPAQDTMQRESQQQIRQLAKSFGRRNGGQ